MNKQLFRIGIWLFFFWIVVLAEEITKYPWKIPRISSHLVDVDTFIDKSYIVAANDSCLGETNNTGWAIGNNIIASRKLNPQLILEASSSGHMIPGSTIWIHEWMALGHIIYDINIIQLLQFKRIDRIVHQRAVCYLPHLCQGVGNWKSWFVGFYGVLVKAFQPDMPIYLRFNREDTKVYPYYLRDGEIVQLNRSSDLPYIDIPGHLCFQHVYIRNTTNLVYGLNPSTAQALKIAAYKIVNDKLKLDLKHTYNASEPIIITFAYRGNSASRHIHNHMLLFNTLNESFPGVIIRMFYTSNASLTFHDQVAVAASSYVIIAEHGAFESNAMFMRNHSLLIEFHGSYDYNNVFDIFDNLSSMFGILYTAITIHAMRSHNQFGFNINQKDCHDVVNIIKAYLEAKPYLKPTV